MHQSKTQTRRRVLVALPDRRGVSLSGGVCLSDSRAVSYPEASSATNVRDAAHAQGFAEARRERREPASLDLTATARSVRQERK